MSEKELAIEELFSLMKVYNEDIQKQIMEAQVKKQAEPHNEDLMQLKNQLSLASVQSERRNEEIRDWKAQIEREKNINLKNRRQMKRCIEMINGKDTELENSRRIVISLKNKIDSLESEIQALNRKERTSEYTTLKTLEGMKETINELSSSVDDGEVDKMLLQNKYKQLQDKSAHLVAKNIQMKGKIQILQDSYGKLKESYRAISSQIIQLKFQVEKYKCKEQEQNDRKSAQSSYPLFKDEFNILYEGLDKAIGLMYERKQEFRIFNERKSLNNLCIQVSQQNKDLKENIIEKQAKIDQLNKIVDEKYADQTLEERHPSLYEKLLQKTKNIEQFQDTLTDVELYIKRKSDELDNAVSSIQTQSVLLNKLKTKQEELLIAEEKLQKYRNQLGEAIQETSTIKGKKKKLERKKRCKYCWLPFQKQKQGVYCEGCKEKFHQPCVCLHDCKEIKEEITGPNSQYV